MKINKNVIMKYIQCILGCFLFAFGFNYLIVPLGLYSGGFVGIGQVIGTVITEHITGPLNFDTTGLLYFMLNLPLFVLAYKEMSKSFFLKTLFCVVVQTLMLSIIPIPTVAVIDDYLAACILGGAISGLGTGLILKAGSSGGGLDILGVYYSSKYNGFSVGKIAMGVNLLLFAGVYATSGGNVEIVVYSMIFTIILNVAIDRVHTQNISVTATIITKQDDMGKYIIDKMNRGVTAMQGVGCYTGEKTNFLVTVLSKYEISKLKRVVREKDERAFVIVNNNSTVLGNYEKRLDQ